MTGMVMVELALDALTVMATLLAPAGVVAVVEVGVELPDEQPVRLSSPSVETSDAINRER